MARRKIQRAEEPKPDLMRWLLTYADMITLLMVFFIILYSIATVNPTKFQEMQAAFSSVFNGGNFTIFDTRGAGGAGVLQGLTPGQRVESNKGGKNAGTGGAVVPSQPGPFLPAEPREGGEGEGDPDGERVRHFPCCRPHLRLGVGCAEG